MKRKFSNEELEAAKSTEFLKFECFICQEDFSIEKRHITCQNSPYNFKYCSLKCTGLSKRKRISLNCKNCDVFFEKIESQISINNFCSRSCAVTFNNTHKITGFRRSKLEIWLEEQLTEKYPDLEIIFNGKEAINSELDIYIPSLSIAFELNGIFHYEPIYGEEKLKQIQNNDNRKFQACLEKDIELCIIDTNSMKNFKIEKAKKYFDIIQNIIETKY